MAQETLKAPTTTTDALARGADWEAANDQQMAEACAAVLPKIADIIAELLED